MTIGYIMSPGRGDTDLLLAKTAQYFQHRGVKTCGIVQINTDNVRTGRCDMDVKVLPDGPVVRISQSLGKQSKGCRLDTSALESAVGHVKSELDRGAQLLIINKFGKQEADGGGFRGIIADAVANGIPVLVGLNNLNKPAFEAFAADLAMALPATEAALIDWVETLLNRKPAAA